MKFLIQDVYFLNRNVIPISILKILLGFAKLQML